MSDSLRPVDCSLPGLLCPWDSPGKNTGVGCHFLLRRTLLPLKTLLKCHIPLEDLKSPGAPSNPEVEDRWIPGLDNWCLSSRVKLKLCFPPDTQRNKDSGRSLALLE